MSQMSQLSKMSHFFKFQAQTVGTAFVEPEPQTDPTQSSHHNFLGFGLYPTNPYTNRKLCSRVFYWCPQNPKTASWKGVMELQSLCVGKIKLFGDTMANHEPPSSTAMQNGSCCPPRPHLLPKPAPIVQCHAEWKPQLNQITLSPQTPM